MKLLLFDLVLAAFLSSASLVSLAALKISLLLLTMIPFSYLPVQLVQKEPLEHLKSLTNNESGSNVIFKLNESYY